MLAAERLFGGDAGHAGGDGAEDFVGNGSGPAGMIVGGDAAAVMLAEDDNFVAGGGVGDVGDVDDGQVHRHAADDWGGDSMDEYVATGGGIGAG